MAGRQVADRQMTGRYLEAVEGLARDEGARGWTGLPFFAEGAARRVARAVDERAKAGAYVLPAPRDVFAALHLTPLPRTRIVVLGQDPYPTPGDAHGLAFSYAGGGRLPASLRNIFRELSADLGTAPPLRGDLSGWARQGVLLLNAVLTVEAGKAGAHRGLGWEALSDQAVRAVSQAVPAAVFLLWGADAQKKRPLIDAQRHLVIESPHPSPLSAHRGFFGSRPFSRANAWLAARGQPPVDWAG
jgi:uracil-DNA glycosylase